MNLAFPRLALNRHSIRTRLLVWNVGVLALILAVLGVLIQYTVRTSLLLSVDRDLAMKPPQGAGHPGGGRPTEGRFPQGDKPGPGAPRPEDRPSFTTAQPSGAPAATAATTVATAKTSDTNELWPRMLSMEGGPLRPPHRDREPRPHWVDREFKGPWNLAAFQRAARGKENFVTMQVGKVPVRLFSKPLVHEDGTQFGVLQIPHPLTEVYKAITFMNRALLTLIPVALLLAALGGAWLTDRALRPVREIGRTAEQIGAQDLSRRLPTLGGDEFSQLATTFNGMLARLEIAFQQKETLVRQLEELVEQQRRFTGDASHELRTPLTVIKANTSLTLQGQPTESEYREVLEEVDRAADSMTCLVQDLLLLTRSDGGQLGRNAVVLSIPEMLEAVRQRLRQPNRAALCLDVEDAALCVTGNPDELTRLVTNLVENALRYTPPDGQVTLAAWGEGATVVLSVADTGIGIAPEHLPHLCERFYRVDAARSRPDGGTGLGLAICKSIVEAHQGTLQIESVVGQGTTVTVRLPRTVE